MTDQQTLNAPRDPERDAATVARIKALVETNRDQAIDLAIRALGDGLRHPLTHHLVAQSLEDDLQLEDAAALLWEARSFAPRDTHILNGLGLLFTRLNRAYEAIPVFDEAIAVSPDLYFLHANKALACVTAGEPVLARRHYEQAAALAPNDPEHLASLADLAIRQGQTGEARMFAERALALRSDQVVPNLVLAQADIADKTLDAAEARLLALLNDPDLDDEVRGRALGLLADMKDGAGRTAEAFAAYTASNDAVRRAFAPLYEPARARRVDKTLEIAGDLERRTDLDWGPAPGDVASPVREHVFLMGFARSGTTLLEQVISGHPDVIALGEKPTIDDAAKRLLEGDLPLEALANLDAEKADEARALYWEIARRYAKGPLEGKILVDKHPLSTARLPLIAKLFPKAKILFIRRDPRDVVLSCFRRRFKINTAMYQFLTLEGAARYYDAVMQVGKLSLARMAFDTHILTQETLVSDFEAQATGVLRFMGADWYEGAWQFSKRAVTAANTPSAAQLARGLSSDTVGVWRKYGADLVPVLPLLEPWAAAFGYAPADVAAYEAERRRRPAPSLGLPSPEQARQERDQTVAELQKAAGSGDWNRAFGIAEHALQKGLKHTMFYRLRGARREQQGKLEEAVADFESAVAATPGDPGALNVLGLCLARVGRLTEGVERLRQSVALRGDFAPAHYNLGWALEAVGDQVAARAAYRRAAQLDPNYVEALSAYASLAGRAGDWAASRDAARRALAIDPGQPVARTALASADTAEGEFAAAEARLREVIADGARAGDHQRAIAWGALGDCLDRQGRIDEAFAAYESGARAFRALYAPRFDRPGVERSTAFAERLNRTFNDTPREAWRRRDAGDSAGAGHVFLVGFPRSGTTLLGQVLARHEAVATLDEYETLADAADAYLKQPGGMTRLLAASDAELAHYRELYWRRVRGAGVQPEGKTFVDKLPMNTLGLPLVNRLFPQAKVLFMRRDPRDVVFSCFRRQFAINTTTFEFLTLADAAGLYDAVMTLAQSYESGLDLNLRIQRYEDVVADFETELKAICGFIGLPWRNDLADFAGRAQMVSTPSAAQISQGLSGEGVGAWRPYARHIEGVTPTLTPWVKRFGYPET